MNNLIPYLQEWRDTFHSRAFWRGFCDMLTTSPPLKPLSVRG